MQLPYSDEIEIQSLGRLFDNTSECYKFFWFQALVTKVLEGKETITYEELINEMIADAWYMVTEYHLNLGPKDTLERLVNDISEISGMKPCEKKGAILDFVRHCTDKGVMQKKRTLTYNVPYRLQAPFMENIKGKAWNVSESSLISAINREKRLMYYFTALKGMQTEIQMQPEWTEYIFKNQDVLKGWLKYNMIVYLQRRNPSVPGIADKLQPPLERKLDKVQKYWKLLLTLEPVHEIYGDEIVTERDISIDHFVPWSYVAHDEFWNLHPTTKSINSSKSNYLPNWNLYFPKLCRLEYFSYVMMNRYDGVKDAFEKCAKEHLNSSEIRGRMYKSGLSMPEFSGVLEEVVQPLYQSAKTCGFRSWVYAAEDKDGGMVTNG